MQKVAISCEKLQLVALLITNKTRKFYSEIKYNKLSIDQISLIKDSHPRPNLEEISKNRKDGRPVTFNTEYYKKHKWLSGCAETKVVYCFWCVLTKQNKTCWATKGLSNIDLLHKSIEQHLKSKKHRNSTMVFKNLGRGFLLNVFDKVRKENHIKQSIEQDKNMRYITALLRTTVFLSRQGLAFRGTDESKDSLNAGNYKEFLKFQRFENAILAEFNIKNKNVLQSPEIQNKMIHLASQKISCDIVDELSKTEFVSIVADEATDSGKQGMLIVFFRYFFESEIKERFVKIINISEDKSATHIAEKINETIEEYKAGGKIISQCYDGAPVMSGKFKGVQKLVRDKHPKAFFIHCIAHQLNLVIIKIIKSNDRAAEIFEFVDSICKFFGHSTSRSAVLEEFIKKKIPTFCKTRWSYNERMVGYVDTYIEELYSVFLKFSESKLFTAQEKIKINFIKDKLTDINMKREIQLLKNIFTVFQALSKCFQKKNYNYFDVKDDLEKTRDIFNGLKLEYASISFCQELIENTQLELDERFDYKLDINFSKIFSINGNKVQKLTKELEALETIYPGIFKIPQLAEELCEMINYKELQGKTPGELFKLNIEHEFIPEEFVEAQRFLKLMSTISINSANAERGFSCLKRTKNYLRTNTLDKRLDDMMRIYLERDISKKMLESEIEIRDLVVKFCSTNKTLDIGLIE